LHPNNRVVLSEDIKDDIKAFDTVSDQIPMAQLKLPFIDPENLIGFKFIADYGGSPYFTQVKEKVDSNKYLVASGDGEHKDILSYNQIINMIDDKMADPDADVWAFEDLLDHRVAKGGKHEVLVKWSTGEETWEPLTTIAQTDPVTVGRYAKDKQLLDTPQWKRFH